MESELRSIKDISISKATAHIQYLREQIDAHEEKLAQMIETLTAEQMDSLRTTIKYLWEKSYSKDGFNKSTLLTLMREQLNFRQKDVVLKILIQTFLVWIRIYRILEFSE